MTAAGSLVLTRHADVLTNVWESFIGADSSFASVVATPGRDELNVRAGIPLPPKKAPWTAGNI